MILNELAGNIFVGVAGWSYPDWKGIVYPPGTKDQLKYLAGYVDMIEINSTFYRPPSASNAASWVRRTAEYPEFFFSAKLNQEVTHEGVVNDAMVRAFHEGLAPMVDAGRLKHLLAQFRYDFADTPESRNLLARIRERFDGLGETVFELRHKSWASSEALEYVGSLKASVANLDYPTASNSFDLHECRVGTEGYLRLHGRNSKAWFDRKAGRDQTYNYYYTRKERETISDRAISLAKTFRSLTIVANNHYEGKEVANALQFKSMLSGKKVRVPPGLLNRYEELAEIASTVRSVSTDEGPTLF